MPFGLFPDFFDHPQNLSFTEQESDEVIELALRRHWVTNIPWIVTALILFVLPPILFDLDQRLNFNFLLQIPTDLILGALIAWYLLVTAYILEQFLHWYFNIYIVTDQHLVDINFYSLLLRDINEAKLDDIQNVSSQVRGIFGSLFYYGDVHIQTAAETKTLDFLSIPNPDIVADRIQDLQIAKEGG